MSKSFVLRDKNGHLSGYLMQREGKIHCRIQDGKSHGILSILGDEGVIAEQEMSREQQEFVWDTEGKEAKGAYLSKEGTLLLHTGELAVQAFLRQTSGQHRQAEKEFEEEQKKNERHQKAHDPEKEEKRFQFPECRWPPPVLLNQPEYRDGRWIQNGEF